MAGVMGTIAKSSKEEILAEKELIMASGRLEDYRKTVKLSPALEQAFVSYDKVFCEYLRTRKHKTALKLSDTSNSPLKIKVDNLSSKHEETGKALVKAILADSTLPVDIKSHAKISLEAYEKSQEILDDFEKKLEEKVAKN